MVLKWVIDNFSSCVNLAPLGALGHIQTHGQYDSIFNQQRGQLSGNTFLRKNLDSNDTTYWRHLGQKCRVRSMVIVKKLLDYRRAVVAVTDACGGGMGHRDSKWHRPTNTGWTTGQTAPLWLFLPAHSKPGPYFLLSVCMLSANINCIINALLKLEETAYAGARIRPAKQPHNLVMLTY